VKRKYQKPYVYNWSSLNMGKKQSWADSVNWNRRGTYMSQKGIVILDEYNFQRKDSVDKSTDFETIIDGRIHRMALYTNGLSDRSLKHFAAHFLNKCIKEST
jgi:hypothetical protein